MVKIKKRNSKGKYTIDGKEYTSVTKHFDLLFGVPSHVVQYYHCKKSWDILKQTISDLLNKPEDLKAWVEKQKNPNWEVAQAMRNDSASYGTRIHSDLERYYFDDKYPVDSIAKRVLEVDSILQREKIEPLLGEQIVWSRELGAAGTCDFIGVKDESRRVVFGDWKTGFRDPEKELMQIAAYGYMVLENQEHYNLPFKISEDQICGMVAHIGKTDEDKVKVDLYTSEDMKRGLEAFKNVQTLLKYFRKIKE